MQAGPTFAFPMVYQFLHTIDSRDKKFPDDRKIYINLLFLFRRSKLF
jgi:hypothetical protein